MDKGHVTQPPISFFERSLGKLLLLCVLVSSLLTFLLIPLADSSARLNARQVFDSSRWHSLQLQLQTYRLMDYLSGITERDLPLQGNAYFQYDLVLSRVDLLRKGDLGRHIRSFANGRATRLLNIIAGDPDFQVLNPHSGLGKKPFKQFIIACDMGNCPDRQCFGCFFVHDPPAL